MTRKKIKYIHLFVWLFAIFANLPYSNHGQDLNVQQIITYLFAFLYLMLVFYLFYIFLVPAFLEKKKIALFFSVSFITALAMPFFGYSLLFLIRAIFDGTFHNFYRGYSLAMHMSGYFPVLIAAVFGSFFKVIINWFSALGQKAELDRQKSAIELELLKSRLNPHFLFNTLNNIDELIRKDPEKASRELLRLSDMMRYLTYDTASERVELGREAEHLRNFIELHRIRLKDPETIEFETSGDLSCMIAPALFVPLAENAFKFVRFRSRKPAIRIVLTSASGIITFEAWNSYERNNEEKSEYSGHGISSLRRRLELTYPGKYRLETEAGESVYHVKLTIDTNEAQLYSN
jgi:two-component system, LytTR family, sensor kinase